MSNTYPRSSVLTTSKISGHSVLMNEFIDARTETPLLTMLPNGLATPAGLFTMTQFENPTSFIEPKVEGVIETELFQRLLDMVTDGTKQTKKSRKAKPNKKKKTRKYHG